MEASMPVYPKPKLIWVSSTRKEHLKEGEEAQLGVELEERR